MISEETVFILGAGASVPYGYPTGAQLRTKIYNNFSPLLDRYFKRTHKMDKELRLIHQAEEISNRFKKSSNQSIDLFLNRNPKFTEIGKLAIVLSIFEYERKSKFREDSILTNQDWYSYLFEKMTKSLTNPTDYKNFGNNKVTFITFNYDRSLEHILYDSLDNSFDTENKNNIAEQIQKIPIFHVYGKVANLPWENNAGTLYQEQGPSKYKYRVFSHFENLKSNIHTIHERNSYDRSEMIKAISEAKRVFFLGFGYASENIEILQLNSSLKKDQKIFGTAFGYSKKEIRDIRQSLAKNFITWAPHDNNLCICDMDCVKLLREYL